MHSRWGIRFVDFQYGNPGTGEQALHTLTEGMHDVFQNIVSYHFEFLAHGSMQHDIFDCTPHHNALPLTSRPSRRK